MRRATKILVVDDDAAMRKTLDRILKAKGFEVCLASSGEEAVAMATTEAPDGLLMDIKMPGIDGVEAFRRIRELCPDAFAVFMTAYSSLADEAAAEGAVAVLGKPLDLNLLCSRLVEAASLRPILIVDDDHGFLHSLARVIKSKGFQVETASDAEQALSVFKRVPRCVVLLDMKLVGPTGLDILRAAHQMNSSVRGIMMTGLSEMVPLMASAAEMGSRAQLTKPIDIDALIELVRECASVKDSEA